MKKRKNNVVKVNFFNKEKDETKLLFTFKDTSNGSTFKLLGNRLTRELELVVAGIDGEETYVVMDAEGTEAPDMLNKMLDFLEGKIR